MNLDVFNESSELNPATASVLRRFALRRSRLIWIRALAVALLSLALTMTIVMLIDFAWLLPTPARVLLSAVGYVLSAAAVWWSSLRFLKNNDRQQIAKQLESVDPRLREDLLSAVELSSVEGANGSQQFRDRLQRMVARRAAGMDVAKLLPWNLLRAWGTASAVVLCLGFILLLIPPLQVGRRIARAMLPGLAIERASITQVKIVHPDPPTTFVANGDAVAITAVVSNLTQLKWGYWQSENGVWLQYQSGDAETAQVEMTPRTTEHDQSAATVHRDEFAANLMMGQSPVRYRIVAGDAVTLWNTLTPRSRPHVDSFVKEYVYPIYSQLPARTVREDHGDLRAVTGTRATVTVHFDEPVTDAIIRMGNRANPFNMKSVDGSTTIFKAMLPMESSNQYQVDATSRQSGLSNPFGRNYSIVPLTDSPPIVRWDESLPNLRVVSPLEVLTLSAEVVDDLPIGRVLQKTIINGKSLDAVPVPLDQESRRHHLSFQWDLFSLDKKLSVGDIVQTRLVAIDRRGQMSDSEVLEFLIAEEGFDTQRHNALDRMHRLTAAIHDWSEQAKPATDAFDAESEIWNVMMPITDSVITKIESELSSITDAIPGSTIDLSAPLEQIGKAIIAWQTRVAMLRVDRQRDTPDEDAIQSLVRQVDLIDEQARTLFSHAVTVGVMSDAISLQRSTARLFDETSPIPAAHYPRHLNLISGRLDATDSLILSHSDQLPESTVQQFEKWNSWSDRWSTALRELSEKEMENETDANTVQERLHLFETELRQQTRHSLLDGRMVSALSQNARQLDRVTESVSDSIDLVGDLLAERDDAPSAGDPLVAALVSKISGEVSLQRQLPSVDLRYTADLNLTKQAIKAVSADDFVAADGEPISQIQQEIAAAIHLLNAAHRVESGRRDIANLASAETRLSGTAPDRIDHPATLERFSTKMEHTVGLLKHAKVDWAIVKPIDQSRFAKNYAEARERITRRRWSDQPILGAAAPLGEIRDQLKQSLAKLAPLITEARSVLLKYAPTIGQQATAAAIDVEEHASTEKSDDVVESLHDLANTSDWMNRDSRELARDADSAAAQIQAAKEKVNGADSAESEPALQNLAEILRATAEHFDRAENGEDLVDSRNELRSGEQKLGLSEDLDQLSERTESIAEAAAKLPEELLKQLEQQLQRNEAMQDELDELATRSEESIQQNLAQLAADENDINQSLEASDPDMRERKRRVAKQVNSTHRTLQSIQESLVAAVQRSSELGKLDTIGDDLKNAQAALDEAKGLLSSLQGERDPMEKLSDTAKRASQAVADVATAMKAIAEKASKHTDQNLGQNATARIQQEQLLQRIERETRRKRISGHRIAESLWKGEQNSAKQRANSQKRKRSEAHRQAKRLQQIGEKLDADSESPQKAQNRQNQIDAFLENASVAERAMKAAEETQRFANQHVGKASSNRTALERQKLEALDQNNPAAQLTGKMAAAAASELQAIEKSLDEAAAEINAADDLLADPDQARNLAERQSRVTEDVQRAADDLQRISRHQNRLDKNARAEELAKLASEIEKGALVTSENAKKDLRDVSESSLRSPEANQQVSRAAQEIADAGMKLADLSAAMNQDNDGDNDGNNDRSSTLGDRQLAKTLDELDQSIAKSQRSASDESPPSSESSTRPKTAGDASITLSSALQAIAQQVARQRQQSTEPGQPNGRGQNSESGQPGENETPSPNGDSGDQSSGRNGDPSASGKPSDESGMPGDPPGGPSVDIADIDRQGSDWGQLRKRSDENSGQAGRALVPNQYRREIEAYFRVIARDKGTSR